MTFAAEVAFVVAGIVIAAGFVSIVRRQRPNDERSLYAMALVVAAGIYVAFGMATFLSMGLELLGLLLFAALAFAGSRVTVLAIGVGWLLHAGWDAWHLSAAVVNPAPDWYSALCIGFDLLLGGYIIANLRPKRKVALPS